VGNQQLQEGEAVKQDGGLRVLRRLQLGLGAFQHQAP
jgi:hypothetical protein